MFKYTVIVPHYNDSKRLSRLLKSIPVERGDIQVLVVDDCSSEQIALSHVRNFFSSVTWLSTEVNKGAGAARNVGLINAEGDWLVFADSDDEFVGDAFDVFDRSIDDEVDLVYFLAGGYNDITDSESLRAERFNDLVFCVFDDESEVALSNLKQWHVVPWAKIYKRKRADGFLFDEVFVGNDVAFNVLVALSCDNIRVVPEMVYIVTKRSDSLTTIKSSENFITRVKVAATLADRIVATGHTSLQSGTGFLLESIGYGPVTLLKTLCVISRSSLRVEFSKILQLGRWKRFFYLKRQN
ncbi:glycosyltransferase family A protein [Oceanimonas sp. CHS3-5]|uniref:glycosyltransferase family 2 protein n=1 Tax=Oceanimonas sp. CHS3-5 TaxID=3068186 RepID=UPI0027402D70|nr:glycosyltransferase family A protein [Oceanimonas sp. CHS3-5]MDP5291625.1 glycosyltransferase family A protein [Oceanimonas sp. CHS3-5]